MSREPGGTAEFERRLRALLGESVARASGRARSRLNQARHAALAEAARPRRWRPSRTRRRALWMPAAGAAAAALWVAVMLWPHASRGYPAAVAGRASAADLELLADGDGMDLMQGGDGQFYEWAMAEADAHGESPGRGAPAGSGGKARGGPDEAAGAERNTG